MLKKLWMLCVALVLVLCAGIAAAVEVNTADQAALESVKGIGPVHAKAIIDERTKNGPFKNADDLATRVKGIGPKSVKNLEAAGLTINGSGAPPTGAAKSTSKSAKSAPQSTATTAEAPAATAPADASGTKASKSKKKNKAAASAPAASGA
ncbi:helix-hairpin-helix domain-containing protein [Paraburkholderia edwinii]|uniref:Helix-hairpin-helix domain-containing protein n=1 Tax=Paraburkholderia edwinii TaxID=2861782 RepID=A0ABX8UPQ1_9BURK|nr:helix-hairpin-helix domain-containing protein [Paraburkholderia edwinii]QYD70591.1 helix-hairpin-helix domain-containing protein [Paraburkholderia edwinii]